VERLRRLRGRIRWRYGLAAAAAAVLLCGCAEMPQRAAPESWEGLALSTLLAPGDMVEISFPYTPELNVTQQIRPDGKISMHLVGEVEAAGLTPETLAGALKELYKDDLVDPAITVAIISQHERQVFVGGEVKVPGPVPMPARMTALDAVMLAGGYKPDTAELGSVLVIRVKDGQRMVGAVDLRGTLSKGEPEEDEPPMDPIYLAPLDIVYVPETQIVKADRWVDQHLNKLVPQFGFIISTTTGNTTVGLDTSP
jgi:protein involved in polysaccharide export with SLBB domain